MSRTWSSFRPILKNIRTASSAVFDLLRTYTELVEPVSIDEAYIDITAIGGLTEAVNIASEMQQRLLQELDLPCSIGIAPNKFLAKTASDMKKPMGITILRKREIETILWPLPVIEMHGIGKSTEKKMHALGIYTIGDLAQADEINHQSHPLVKMAYDFNNERMASMIALLTRKQQKNEKVSAVQRH